MKWQTTSVPADDLLTGVKEIAAFTGKTERQIYHIAERRQIKGLFKVGGYLAPPQINSDSRDRDYGGEPWLIDRTAA